MTRPSSPDWLRRLLPLAPMPALVRLARFVGVWTPTGETEADRARLAVRVTAAISGGTRGGR